MFAFVALAMAAPAEPEVEKKVEAEAADAPAQQDQPPRDKRGYVLGTYTYSEPLVYNSYPTVYRTAPVHYARTYTYPSYYSGFDSHLVL